MPECLLFIFPFIFAEKIDAFVSVFVRDLSYSLLQRQYYDHAQCNLPPQIF